LRSPRARRSASSGSSRARAGAARGLRLRASHALFVARRSAPPRRFSARAAMAGLHRTLGSTWWLLRGLPAARRTPLRAEISLDPRGGAPHNAGAPRCIRGAPPIRPLHPPERRGFDGRRARGGLDDPAQ
jgi:hypothetical protein